MLSHFTSLCQQLTIIEARRTLTQFTKQTFSQRWKRRLRNVVIIGIVGFGINDLYHRYRRHQWFNEMEDANKTIGTKPRLIVLGTGWGAVSLLKHIDTQKYEVICISPRNYFLMTPLLPAVSVGTIETRTVIESIRSLIGPRIQYLEAHCVDVDVKSKIITCHSTEEIPKSATNQDGASSRVVKDSARTRPVFNMNYDVLVVAIGSENNTFNTPGVEEYTHRLKELPDARRIRSAISDAFESAISPAQTEEKRKNLLHFVIVGGGPTGVEFAAELADLIREDLRYYFPRLVPNDVKLTLIQSSDHILSTMDKRISEYTEKHFRRENIEVLTNMRVKEVKQGEVIVQAKGSDGFTSIPCSVTVWATGIKARPLVNQIREVIGLDIQSNRMGLLTDPYLRVKGSKDGSMFAIGDCATIEQAKLTDRIQLLFEEADTEHRDALNLEQFRRLVEQKINEFPQLEIYSKSIEKAFAEADKEKSGHLTLSSLRSILEKADQKIRALPATAQVAHQQGLYIAHLLNQSATIELEPFKYKHMGSLAYVGGDSAVLDFTDTKPLWNLFYLKPLSGHSAAYLWRSFYFTEMFTGRTKTLLAFDWLRTELNGREISRY